MEISISDLNQKVTECFAITGLNEKDAQTMANLVVEQELLGNQFSAVGELNGKHQRLLQNIGSAAEEIAAEKPAMKLIKGNGRLAPLVTADHLQGAISKAKQQGIYALGIYDSTYNDFF